MIRINQALAALGDADREIQQLLPAMSTGEMVVLGQRLWWLIKRATKTLDPIKVRFREIALQNGNPGTFRFEAPDDNTHCIVVIPTTSPVLRKDVDIAGVKALLGDAKFDQLFETTVSYRPKKDLQVQIGTLTQPEQDAVMSVLDLADATPKVSFKD